MAVSVSVQTADAREASGRLGKEGDGGMSESPAQRDKDTNTKGNVIFQIKQSLLGFLEGAQHVTLSVLCECV